MLPAQGEAQGEHLLFQTVLGLRAKPTCLQVWKGLSKARLASQSWLLKGT